MNLRQRTSRYCAAVLFLAGVNAALTLFSIVNSGFEPAFEVWLAGALIASLILHARAGFALSRADQEIELLRRESRKIQEQQSRKKHKPAIVKLEPARGLAPDDASALDRVKDAIEAERIDLHLQPIVSLPQRKTRYFEAFARLRNRDGTVLRPAHYLDAAERANRIGAIDNLILLRSIQALRNLGAESRHYRIFCNISPATIFDNDFFARFTDYLDANRDLAPRLVFEFTYPAVEMMQGEVDKNLQAIAERGYAFSVDHIRRFDLNWKSLRERNFMFVKASSDLLLGAGSNGVAVRSFRDRLRETEMSLIVEKVELESHVPEIVSLGIDFGQGNLFGAPRPASFYIHPDLELAAAS